MTEFKKDDTVRVADDATYKFCDTSPTKSGASGKIGIVVEVFPDGDLESRCPLTTGTQSPRSSAPW